MEQVIKELGLQYIEGISKSNQCNIYSFQNDKALISDFDFWNSRKISKDTLFLFYRVDNIVTWEKWPIELFLDYGVNGLTNYIDKVLSWRVERIKKEQL